MTVFPKTRAAVLHVMNHAHDAVSRRRAVELATTLGRYETIAAGQSAEQPSALAVLRLIVIRTRILAGRDWLRRNLDTPHGSAFNRLLNSGHPPPAEDLDRILAGVLWARFPPRRLGRVSAAVTHRGAVATPPG